MDPVDGEPRDPAADPDDPDWTDVRDSWVGDRPSNRGDPAPAVIIGALPDFGPVSEPAQETLRGGSPRPKSVPPPFPSTPPAARLDLQGRMMERLAVSDYDGALRAANAVMRDSPDDEDAIQCREMARAELRKLYEARLGGSDRVPRMVARAPVLRTLDVGVGAGLIVACVDGIASVGQIAESGVLPQLEALRILSELYLSGAIAFED